MKKCNEENDMKKCNEENVIKNSIGLTHLSTKSIVINQQLSKICFLDKMFTILDFYLLSA
jgi:hypothetical protein